ncbi:hypothetical protein PYCCODRAFT_1472693 [Trametes coccinea BRFM310]|uniref:Uncharacterized protein n=1 Tax=Trametes coccinea (strain BRFM310) TaxID=1353009 RepID=A0A1Y2I6X8_TRAC3|nr:hypothetical protein PYCCODRAFT_1472693 [Trametes coccinea BRFM310]
MQQRPSKTYQRIRKLSDSIVNAITPTTRYEPHHRTRKISTDDIGKPRPHPAYSMEGWLTKDDREPKAPRRPERPSVDARPPVIRDPTLRERERQVFHAANTAKRPERPREEDLPYGAKGSVPIVDAPWLRTEASSSRPAAVPFPSTPAAPAKHQKSQPQPAQEDGRRPRDSEMARYRFPQEPARETFSPFATVGRAHADGHGGAHRATSSMSRAGNTSADAVHGQSGPATVHRHGAIRRTSRTRDAALQQVRQEFGRSEHALVQSPARTHVGLQRSHTIATPTTERLLSASPATPAVAPRQAVAAKAKASVLLHNSQAPQQVKLSAPDSQRVTSLKAEIVKPRERSQAEGSRAREPAKDEGAGEQGKSHVRRKVKQTVEHYPMTYYFEEVKRGLGDAASSMMPTEAFDAMGLGVGGGTEPLRPRKKDQRNGDSGKEVQSRK